MRTLIIIIFLLSITFPIASQTNPESSPIIFIYDASGSMWGQINGITKMEIAKSVLSTTVNGLSENQAIGLVAYGHRQKGDCEDVETLLKPTNVDKVAVNNALSGIKPLGKTPLAFSALQVIEQLRSSGEKATIILLTDGVESCDGDLCAVIKAAKEEGISFKLHIIGFGLKEEETTALRCAAKAGEGQYHDAASSEDLTTVLNAATQTTVDVPDGTFTIYAEKNAKAIDAMVHVFKAGTKDEITSGRTYQDTLSLFLPLGKYDLKVRPLENSDVPATTLTIEVLEDKENHQTVRFDAGKILVNATNNSEGWDAVVKIYFSGTNKSAAIGRTYAKTRDYELNPGYYDVVLEGIKMKGLDIKYRQDSVVVKAKEEQLVEHDFKTGILKIGATSTTGLVDCTVNIYEVNTMKNVANGRTYKSESSNPKAFLLSPGKYEVRIRALGAHAGNEEKLILELKAEELIEHILNF